LENKTRVREVYKRINKRNPNSGHEWTEPGPTTEYEVVGRIGVISFHKKESVAESIANEWQEFYNKFPL
jgi:hypothetical protein